MSRASINKVAIACLQSPWLYHLTLTLLLMAAALSTIAINQPQISATALASIHDYRSVSCTPPSAQPKLPRFRVLTVSNRGAKELANQLCNAPPMANRFSQIEVTWLHRDQLSARDIVDETYDLFWSRDRRVQHLVPNLEQYYQPIVKLPSYEVAWFSLKGQPELTKEYFYQHSIGLLEDLESNSHFLLPLTQMKSLGVDLGRAKIVYYSSYYELRQAFWSGEVDLISDGLWLVKESRDRSLYWATIDNGSPMGHWYARQNRDRALDCTLLTGLTPLITAIGADLKNSQFAVDADNCP
ncbi:hypothetical protein [Halioxenophilus sp. WMMB6]|uniref:hypothetical protein n=1 Tax=Halioxenophilus sp. WMMB6 TaxID=3073815 RepID=UPI00295F3A5B|nr:hypothetical protein [Halioxenophilus sp. WMMB6]